MEQNPYMFFTAPREPIAIIAGDTVSIPYLVTDDNGNPVDLTDPTITISWKLATFTTPSITIFTKTTPAQITLGEDAGTFDVQLVPGDTSALSGLYLYQIVVAKTGGHAYRRIQGMAYITTRIP